MALVASACSNSGRTSSPVGGPEAIHRRAAGEATEHPLLEARRWGAAMEREPRESTRALVELALAHASDPAVREAVRLAVRGHEADYFQELWGRVAHESRAVESVVHDAAVGATARGGARGRLMVVREVWSRSCCMRGSYLVSALDGLAEGMPGSGLPETNAEIRLALDELGGHSDPAVVAAAGRAAKFFRVPTEGLTRPR